MSGDIGRGATKETIDFAVHLATAQDRPPGASLDISTWSKLYSLRICEFLCLPTDCSTTIFYFFLGFLQLAGGTNAHTVDCLKKVGLFQTWAISGNNIIIPSFDMNGFFLVLSRMGWYYELTRFFKWESIVLQDYGS